MRPLEVVMLVALVPAIAGLFIRPRRRPPWWTALTVVPVVVGLAHALIEGYRWQMVPAYALAIVFLTVALARRRGQPADATQSRARTALRIAGAALGVLALTVAIALPLLFPVFRLPQPTGPHLVGFTRFALLDRTRQELFTTDPTDRRALVVEAWYPADAAGGDLAMFWGPRVMARRLAPALGLPSFLFDHLALVRTHAYTDVRPAATPAPFPVLKRTAFFRQAIAGPRLLHESLQLWTDDTRFVMDELTRMTAGDGRGTPATVAFAGKLDVARIGVFGMSFGGTTAGQLCVVEPRCRAGVNLDGTQYGDAIDVPLQVPFMFMTSAIRGMNDPVYERAIGPAYSVHVEGSTHFNYTDFSLLSPVFKRMGFLGPIDGARMERIMNHYLVAFFDTYVKGERERYAALLDPASSLYPEVQLSSRVP